MSLTDRVARLADSALGGNNQLHEQAVKEVIGDPKESGSLSGSIMESLFRIEKIVLDTRDIVRSRIEEVGEAFGLDPESTKLSEGFLKVSGGGTSLSAPLVKNLTNEIFSKDDKK